MVSTSQNKGFMSRLAGETPDVGACLSMCARLCVPCDPAPASAVASPRASLGFASHAPPNPPRIYTTHTPHHHQLAGRVNIRECHGLFDTLQMVAGGSSFMPGACTAMLNKEQSDLGAKFEAENAKVRAWWQWHGTFVSASSIPVRTHTNQKSTHTDHVHPFATTPFHPGVQTHRAPQLVGRQRGLPPHRHVKGASF